MIGLYHNDMSVCAQKVRLALAELGLEWESHHLKLRGDEQLRPDYLAINPKGQVPALVDDGFVVVESTVINEYLADAHVDGRLLPGDAHGRARMRWWTRQLDDDVHSSVGIVSQAIAFRHQYLATGTANVEHILASIPDEARRDIKRKAFTTGLNNPDLPKAARRMSKLLGDMDAALSTGEWLAGDTFSLADVGMTPYVVRLEQLAMTMMFERRPHLAAWLGRVKARPSYEAAMTRWFNQDYLTLSESKGRETRDLVSTMLQAA